MGWWQVLGDYLTALFGAVGDVLTLDAQALDHIGRFTWSVPIGVTVVGGISLMIGQSIMLAINRVGRGRSMLTLLASGLGSLVVAAVAAALVGLLGRLALGNELGLGELLPAVLLSFAPYWLGFLILLPYTGEGVARIVQVWQMVALWVLLTPVMATDRASALLLAAVVLLANFAVGWLVDGPPLRLRQRFFRVASGSQWHTWRDVRASARFDAEPRS